MEKTNRLPLLLLLLVLLCSVGLNCYLLAVGDKLAAVPDPAAEGRVVESELELRLMQSQLAQCQAEHSRKDSALVRLQSHTRFAQKNL